MACGGRGRIEVHRGGRMFEQDADKGMGPRVFRVRKFGVNNPHTEGGGQQREAEVEKGERNRGSPTLKKKDSNPKIEKYTTNKNKSRKEKLFGGFDFRNRPRHYQLATSN